MTQKIFITINQHNNAPFNFVSDVSPDIIIKLKYVISDTLQDWLSEYGLHQPLVEQTDSPAPGSHHWLTLWHSVGLKEAHRTNKGFFFLEINESMNDVFITFAH